MLIILSRGAAPHPPNTDRREVRHSITLQFNGAPGGPLVAHLFNDGGIKSSEQMYQEINQRRAEDKRLAAGESKFPALHQTAARRQAKTRTMTGIQAARNNNSWSTMQKQLEKQRAGQEYNLVLQTQAQARATAAQAAAQAATGNN